MGYGQPIFWIVAILYTLFMIYLGIRANKESKNAADFFIGGRKLGAFAVAMSMFATMLSASGYVGSTSAGYSQGLAFIWLSLGATTGLIVFNVFIGPRLWYVGKKYGFYTVSEFITKRFDSKAIGCTLAIGTAVFVAFVMYGQFKFTAIMMEAITGLDYIPCLLIALVIMTVYTVSGGIKGVVWTDVIQGVLMVAGALTLIFVSINKAGGLVAMNTVATAVAPKAMKWCGSYSAGFGISWVFLMCFNYNATPYTVQRGFMAKNAHTFKTVLAYAVVAYFIVNMMKVTGIASIVLEEKGLFTIPASKDYMFPALATTILPSGIAALILVTALAAIMSTGDSLLMNVGTLYSNEIYKKYINKNADDAKLVSITRWTMIFVVIFMAALAITEKVTGFKVPIIYYIVQLGTGGLTTLYLPGIVYGLFGKKTSAKGLLTAQLVGFIVVVAAFICRNGYMGDAVKAAYMTTPLTLWGFHEGALGSIVALIVAPIASLFTKAPSEDYVAQFKVKKSAIGR